MKKSFRGLSKSILIIIALCSLALLVYAAIDYTNLNKNIRGYKSVHSTSTIYTYTGSSSYNSGKIFEHNTCKRIASNTCGSDVFIPTKTTGERSGPSGFVENAPSCITLQPCLAEIDWNGDTFNRDNDNCYRPNHTNYGTIDLGHEECTLGDELWCVIKENEYYWIREGNRIHFTCRNNEYYERQEVSQHDRPLTPPLCLGGRYNHSVITPNQSTCTDGELVTVDGRIRD